MKFIPTVVLAAAALVSTLTAADAQEVYVPNYADRTVSVLNAVTLAPVGVQIRIRPPVGPECEEGGNPDGVAFTQDHRYAFVAIDSCDQIAVINTASRTVEYYIDTVPGQNETQIFLRPAGDRMYVTNCSFPTVAVIDVTDPARAFELAVIDLDPTDAGTGGSYEMAFAPEGAIGYATNFTDDPSSCNGPRGVYRLDLDNNVLLDLIATSQNVNAVAVSPDGTAALATTTGGNAILVLDLTNHQEIGVVMCGVDPCAYGNTAAGLAYTAGGTRAYALDAATNDLITIDTTDPLHPVEVARTAVSGPAGLEAWELVISGTRLFVVLYGFPSEVARFDISTGLPVQASTNGVAGLEAFELDVWPAPRPLLSTGGKAYGAGRLSGPGDITFVFVAWSDSRGRLKGYCEVRNDTRPKEKITCLDVTEMTVVGNTAIIRGHARHNGVLTTYEIQAVDSGYRGRNHDTFSVMTGTGFARTGELRSGNIVVIKSSSPSHPHDDDDDHDYDHRCASRHHDHRRR